MRVYEQTLQSLLFTTLIFEVNTLSTRERLPFQRQVNSLPLCVGEITKAERYKSITNISFRVAHGVMMEYYLIRLGALNKIYDMLCSIAEICAEA